MGEFHRFEAAGAKFPLPGPSRRDLRRGHRRPESSSNAWLPGELPHEQLVDGLTASGLAIEDAEELIGEMYLANVILSRDSTPDPPSKLPKFFPFRRW